MRLLDEFGDDDIGDDDVDDDAADEVTSCCLSEEVTTRLKGSSPF